ncbi:MAG: FAD-binding protein [Deltaproteobacteria bacterium]|nr:FAD-binding protein [Deltaproteobacteria bacterium]
MVENIKIQSIDVLVIGGGLAAAFAAIKAKENGAGRVVQVCKGRTGCTGNSAFAASVMHVCFPEDDLDDRVKRLTRSLAYIAQQDLIQDHLEESYPILLEMDSFGCGFLKDEKGNFIRAQARGAYPTVMFRGHEMMQGMREAEIKRGVELVDGVMVTDLLTREGRVIGAVGFNFQNGDFHIFEAKTTILATGSTWYKGLLPGHRDDTGDGYGMAYRAGVLLSGGECNDQLTNLFPRRFDMGPGMNRWVGEGGVFINAQGDRFMERYNPKLKDRAGLAKLTAAFCMEVKRGNGPIYMDMRHIPPEGVRRLKETLIIPMKMFERAGVETDDRILDLIEWSPAAPVGRPGPAVNRKFETSMPGLYACGEAACPDAVVTGLAAAATSGAKAGTSAADFAKQAGPAAADPAHVKELRERIFAPLHREHGIDPEHIILSMQEAVIPYDALLIRHGERMKAAIKKINTIRDSEVPRLYASDPHYLRTAHEAENLLMTAEIQLKAALYRKDSRTGVREDYPFEDNRDWLKFVRARKGEKGIQILTQDIPMEKYPIQIERKKEVAYLWRMGIDAGSVTLEGDKIAWV